MSRPSWVSWAMMSARLDIYSILGMATGRVKGDCHLATLQFRWFSGMDVQDGRDFLVEDSWIPAPHQVRGGPVSGMGQAVIFSEIPLISAHFR